LQMEWSAKGGEVWSAEGGEVWMLGKGPSLIHITDH
jgi:hypothetical protein